MFANPERKANRLGGTGSRDDREVQPCGKTLRRLDSQCCGGMEPSYMETRQGNDSPASALANEPPQS